MCRSIKQLRQRDEYASDEEVRAAALQFVRKVSGYRQPSRANAPAFDAAVDDIAAASKRLLATLTEPRHSERSEESPRPFRRPRPSRRDPSRSLS